MSDNRNDNSFQIGILGLVFGFIAGATAVILSDPDKREKVKEKATEVLDQTKTTTIDTVNTLADTIKEKTETVRKSVNDAVSQVQNSVESEIKKTEQQQNEA